MRFSIPLGLWARTLAQLAGALELYDCRRRTGRIPDWPLRASVGIVRRALQHAVLFPLHDVLARPFVIHGVERLQGLRPPALFIANHTSHIDSVSIIRALPEPICRTLAVAAAADYFYRSAIVGSATSLLLNTFPFSRQGAVRASLAHCEMLVHRGWSVLLYPEGTRSTTGTLAPFRNGIAFLASRLRVPVVPVAVVGGSSVLPKGHALPCRGAVRVVFGPPLHWPAGIESSQAVSQLHQAVAELMNEATAACA